MTTEADAILGPGLGHVQNVARLYKLKESQPPLFTSKYMVTKEIKTKPASTKKHILFLQKKMTT